MEDSGFRSLLCKVSGTLYTGRHAAGGVGDKIDINRDGETDVEFGASCGFILQLDNGRVKRVESDRAITMKYDGRSYRLQSYTPVEISD
jgi:hypothetical protein